MNGDGVFSRQTIVTSESDRVLDDSGGDCTQPQNLISDLTRGECPERIIELSALRMLESLRNIFLKRNARRSPAAGVGYL